jgi:MFS family permease
MTEEIDAGAAEGLLAASPMTGAQIAVVCVTVLLSGLDGYDVLGTAFVAPAVSHAWHLEKATVGALLSMSLLGMAIGSIGLSPLADVAGRKPLVFGGVLLMVLGSLLSAFCQSVPELALCRVLTGVGIGIMVALTTTLASEFASAKGRSFAVAATTVGFAAGSTVGGLIASVLLKHATWPAVFLSGAVVGILLLPVVAFGLPESPAYLISRRTANALERLNKVLARLGRPSLAALPAAAPQKRASYAALFTSGMLGLTLTYVAVMVLVSTATYYLLNWLPQMIADEGFTPSQGSLVAAMPALVGMISGLLWGLAANRFGPARLAAFCAIGSGCAMAAFGFTPPVLGLLMLVSGVMGFFAGGSAGLFYATMATTLPPLIRATGIGLVIGVGRVFSILGPLLAGVMFAGGLSRATVSLIFACAPVVAGLLLLVVTRPRSLGLTASVSGALG